MTEEIYGDVLFLVNFSMDFLSLFLAGKILHDPLRAWRLIVAASIGAAYGVASLFFDFGAVWNFVVTLAVTMLMSAIAYDVRRFGTFFAKTALFAAIGMLLGGMMTTAFTKLGKYETYVEIGGAVHTIYGDIPMWIFLLLATASAFFTWGIGVLISHRRVIRTCEMRLRFSERETTLSALVDSGNLVTEPISGAPVIFIKSYAADFLPEDLRLAMANGAYALDYDTARRLRLVPYRTVDGDHVLVTAVPDACYLRRGRAFEGKKALIAMDLTPGDFGGYPALVPDVLV